MRAVTKMSSMATSVELELKFLVERDAATAWLTKLLESGQARSDIELSFVRSTYYDTAEYSIHRDAKSTLRHRMVSGQQDLTLKSEFLPLDAVLARTETTQKLSDGSDFSTELAQFVQTHLGEQVATPCVPVFTMNIVRQKISVAYRTALIEVVYDRGDITAPGNRNWCEPVSEIEFELASGAPSDLFAFVSEQLAGDDWVQTSFSKAQRGYALVNKSSRLRPRKHSTIEAEGLDADHLFFVNMHSALHHLLDNNPAYLKDTPNAIHQTRVAIRRIRAILRLFKEQLSYFDRKALNGELRWLQAKLGSCRDWYVLYDQTLSEMTFLSEEECETIRGVAQSQHDRELEKALALYRSARTQRLIVHLQGWLASNPLQQATEVERLRYKAFKRNRRRMQAKGDLVSLFHEDLQDVHAVRILGKKFRYALEIFPDPSDQKLAKDLAQMQEYLGTVNDIDRALSLLLTHDEMRISARTRNRIQKWVHRQSLAYVKKAAPYLSEVIAHDPRARLIDLDHQELSLP